MPRGTLNHLTRVPGYDAAPYIESLASALAEDVCRVERARHHSSLASSISSSVAIRDMERLDRGRNRKRARFSQASAFCMREWRLPAIEQLWRLLDVTGIERCRMWSLIPPRWIFTPEELALSTARRLTQQVRSQLNRHGAGDSDGWLIGKLDIEFDTRNCLSRVHAHGIASDGMIEVLDNLRGDSFVRPQLTPMIDGRRVARPLQINRDPPTNLPMPISYMFKSHFTARWLGHNEAGEVKRGNRGLRIPEPYGTDHLLWLDRQPLPDMFVKFGLNIKSGQLLAR